MARLLKLKKYFKNLNDNQQIAFLNASFILVVALCFLPFCFIFFSTFMLSLLYGWLLGGLISVACFAMLVGQINGMTSDKEGVRMKAMSFYFGRFLLYAAGLCLAGYLYYINVPVINIFAVCAAYMPIRVIIITYRRKARLNK